MNDGRRDNDGFIPALRFHRLTPLFDFVAAVAVRDRVIKRRVLSSAAIASGEDVLDVGCGTGTLAVAAARTAPAVVVDRAGRGRGDPPARPQEGGSGGCRDRVRRRGGQRRFRMRTPASTSCCPRSSSTTCRTTRSIGQRPSSCACSGLEDGLSSATWGDHRTRSCGSRCEERFSCSTGSPRRRSTSGELPDVLHSAGLRGSPAEDRVRTRSAPPRSPRRGVDGGQGLSNFIRVIRGKSR